ncbi:MAG: hypothetical protein HQL87_15260, partial [Magnetococcales bacterium]|nr:hypothetical protein [Magnetococcales bacterium]
TTANGLTVANATTLVGLTGFNANGHTYDVVDTAANIVSGTAAVGETNAARAGLLLSANATTTANGLTVANAATLVGLTGFNANGHTYDVVDTAANILGGTAAVGETNAARAGLLLSANATTTANGLTVANAATLVGLTGFNANGHTYDVVDTAANILGGTAAAGETNAARAGLLLSVDATDLTANDAATLASLTGFSVNTHALTVLDSAYNIIASATAATVTGATAVKLSSNATGLTIANANTLTGLSHYNANGYTFTITDTAANISARITSGGGLYADATTYTLSASATDLLVSDVAALQSITTAGKTFSKGGYSLTLLDSIAHLTGHTADGTPSSYSVLDTATDIINNVNSSVVTGAAATKLSANVTNLSVADAATLTGAHNFTANGHTYTLSDSALNLAAASAGLLTGAASITVTGIDATADQAHAIVTAHATGNTYSISDTSANLANASSAVRNGATNLTASDAATVAQATVIEGASNSGTKTYSISDTAAAVSGTLTAVLNGATSITASGNATAAQAAIIEAATPSAANTHYSISDTAANVATATALVRSGATNIAITDNATVAQLTTILANHANNNTYSISDAHDTVAAAGSTMLGGATNIILTGNATVSEVSTVQAAHASNNTYSISDVHNAVAFAAANVLNGATNIIATGDATVAEALTIHGASNSGTKTYNIGDDATTIATAVGSNAATLTGATNITVTGTATAAQATTIYSAGNSGTKTYSIKDTAANVANDASAVLNGATVIDATGSDGTSVATVAQATTIESATPDAAHTHYSISDTALALGGAISTVLNGATNITATTAATAAQAITIHNATASSKSYSISDAHDLVAAAGTAVLSGASSVVATGNATAAEATTIHGANSASTYNISDTAAHLVAAGSAVDHGATNITVTDSSVDPTLSVTDSATIAQLNTIHGYYANPGTFTYTSIADNAANLVTDANTNGGLGTYLSSTVDVTILNNAANGPADLSSLSGLFKTLTEYDSNADFKTAFDSGSVPWDYLATAIKVNDNVVDGQHQLSLTDAEFAKFKQLTDDGTRLDSSDSIQIDGGTGATIVLPTAHALGGDGTLYLGGSQNGSENVTLNNVLKISTIYLEGTGHHTVAAASTWNETFHIGSTQTGTGSSITNLRIGDHIVLDNGDTTLTNATTSAAVTANFNAGANDLTYDSGTVHLHLTLATGTHLSYDGSVGHYTVA